MAIQHTHAILTNVISGMGLYVHYFVAEFSEGRALQRLGEEVRYHVPGGTLFTLHLTICNTIGNKEVSYVDVPCPFAALASPILLQKHCTLVVLIDD